LLVGVLLVSSGSLEFLDVLFLSSLRFVEGSPLLLLSRAGAAGFLADTAPGGIARVPGGMALLGGEEARGGLPFVGGVWKFRRFA
jgi:hypothetical protein